MKELVDEVLGSKKAMAAIVGALAVFLVHLAAAFHVAIDQATATEVSTKLTAIVGAYLMGQGLADHGATAAEATADSAHETLVRAVDPPAVAEKKAGAP